jgi:hypothetical protein
MVNAVLEEEMTGLNIDDVINIPENISFAQLRRQILFLENHLKNVTLAHLETHPPGSKHHSDVVVRGCFTLGRLNAHRVKAHEMAKTAGVKLSR